MLPCVHYWVPTETDAHGEPIFAGFPAPKTPAACRHCKEKASFTYREWHDIPVTKATLA